MARELFRIHPRGGPELFKTYEISAPVSTHFRKATCREVECDAFRNGFVSLIDVSTELGRNQAEYIRSKVHGRVFTEDTAGPSQVRFTFPSGQNCFRSDSHQVPVQREPLYIVRDGDYRGNPRGTRPVRRTADEWVDEFGTHQQSITDAHQKG